MHQELHPRTRNWNVSLHDATSPRRATLEAWIHSRYRSTHSADIDEFLQQFLVVDTLDGSPIACAGFGSASESPLFLEQYLDEPVETLLSDAAEKEVSRSSVVEIGNLAARSLAALTLLFSGMDSILREMDFDWAVFTATETVRGGLESAGFPLIDLGPADMKFVGDPATWGTYYDCAPRLCVIRHQDVEPTGPTSRRLAQLCSDCRLLGRKAINERAA